MGSPEDLIGPSTHHGCRRKNHWVDQQTETENIRNLFVSPRDRGVSSMISPSSKSIIILCYCIFHVISSYHNDFPCDNRTGIPDVFISLYIYIYISLSLHIYIHIFMYLYLNISILGIF